jgi:hypothetical protein
MAAVKINRGMPRPEAPASTLPRDQWRDLAIVRELWAKSQLPFDCRLLQQVAADAPLMAPELGYDTAEAFLRQELQLDPDLVNRVVGWLEQEQPTEPVSLREVEAALGSHGGDRRSEQARQDQGSDHNLEIGRGTAYLKARLQRDHPEIAEALDRGEFRSARAAAIEAGIIKPVATVRLVDDMAAVASKLRQHLTTEQLEQLKALL